MAAFSNDGLSMVYLYTNSDLSGKIIKQKFMGLFPTTECVQVVDGFYYPGYPLRSLFPPFPKPLEHPITQLQQSHNTETGSLKTMANEIRIQSILMKSSKGMDPEKYRLITQQSLQDMDAKKFGLLRAQAKLKDLEIRQQQVYELMDTHMMEICKILISMQHFVDPTVGCFMAISLLDHSLMTVSDQSFTASDSTQDFVSLYQKSWRNLIHYHQVVCQLEQLGGFQKTFRVLVSDHKKQSSMRDLLNSFAYLIPHGLVVIVDCLATINDQLDHPSAVIHRNNTSRYQSISAIFSNISIRSLDSPENNSTECKNLCLVM